MLIHCAENEHKCDYRVFLFYPGLAYSAYQVRIALLNEDLYKTAINLLTFDVITHNRRYVTIMLLIRYFLALASLIALFYYMSYYIKIPKEFVTFEHNSILMMSVALVFFNDPFYGMTLLMPGTFSVFMSTIFITSFISLLVYFWMIMFQRIYKEPLRTDTNLARPLLIILACVIFILMTSTALASTILRRFDPGVNVDEELAN